MCIYFIGWLQSSLIIELNVEDELQTLLKKSKAILSHVDYFSRRHFFVCQLKIVFYLVLHELKQRSIDVTGRY